jgi:hypothetical protein
MQVGELNNGLREILADQIREEGSMLVSNRFDGAKACPHKYEDRYLILSRYFGILIEELAETHKSRGCSRLLVNHPRDISINPIGEIH